MMYYQNTDKLIDRQKMNLEKALLNPGISVNEGFSIYSQIEDRINFLETNFYYISKFLKKLSNEDKKLLFEYTANKNTGLMISKAYNFSERTLYRRLMYPSMN